MSLGHSLVVCGTLTLDTTERAGACHADVPGGSALYAAAAARLLLPTRLLGVVGSDFPMHELAPLWHDGVDATHLTIVPGRTFRWHARYAADGNKRETLARDAGVTQTHGASIPPQPPEPHGLLLGSMHPRIQMAVLDAHPQAALVGLDSMIHWWTDHAAGLEALLPRIDVLFVDVAELAIASGTDDVEEGVARLLRRGPACVVVKHGSRGAWMQRRDQQPIQLPAFAMDIVVDTTGAGDAFAGAWIGSRLISQSRDEPFDRADAMALSHATAIASFAVAGVGAEALMRVTAHQLRERLAQLAPLRTGALANGT